MSNQQLMLDDTGLAAWTALVTRGVNNAISGLAEMVGREITVTSMNARKIQMKDASQLVGGAEANTAAIYLSIAGPGKGHIVVIYQPQTALDLIDMLLGAPQGSTKTMGEMEQSALAEMGNIVGSFFLNALSNATGLDLRVSPPSVMVDMAGAILDAIVADVMLEADEALVVDTTFGTSDRQINGTFLAIPSMDLQSALLDRWRMP